MDFGYKHRINSMIPQRGKSTTENSFTNTHNFWYSSPQLFIFITDSTKDILSELCQQQQTTTSLRRQKISYSMKYSTPSTRRRFEASWEATINMRWGCLHAQANWEQTRHYHDRCGTPYEHQIFCWFRCAWISPDDGLFLKRLHLRRPYLRDPTWASWRGDRIEAHCDHRRNAGKINWILTTLWYGQPSASLRIRNLFINYHTILQAHVMSWVTDENFKTAVRHILHSIRPASLKRRLISDLNLSQHLLMNKGFWKHVIYVSKA